MFEDKLEVLDIAELFDVDLDLLLFVHFGRRPSDLTLIVRFAVVSVVTPYVGERDSDL